MGKKRNGDLFIWDEAQCFIGSDKEVATTYMNEHITMTFLQSGDGTLVGIAYETENDEGNITLKVEHHD